MMRNFRVGRIIWCKIGSCRLYSNSEAPQEVYLTNSGFLNTYNPEAGEAQQPDSNPKSILFNGPFAIASPSGSVSRY